MRALVKTIFISALLLLFSSSIVSNIRLPDVLKMSVTKDSVQLDIMPLPAKVTFGRGHFVLESDLNRTFKNSTSPKLRSAVERFYSKLNNFTNKSILAEGSAKLILDCKNTNMDYPSVNDSESYKLIVTKDDITISADSETGILYGLESLLQLVKKDKDNWIIPVLEIDDKPRYPWRGLLIDAGKHWMPKDVILRNLEAMATLKMNVLHWHFTEYQGFRVESKMYPKLHEMGSEGNYYSQEDIKEVISYASDRGIRVVPEFDLPGHSTSWFLGHPELASAPGPYALDTRFGVLDPVLDPTREEVYVFLDNFFGEMAALFPDEYLHIGGDEVHPTHWEENEAIQRFMKENRMKDHHDLQAYFNIRLQKILEKHNKKMMGWDEIIHPDLPKENIAVQSWRNVESLWDAARGGNKAVLSNGYYLDYKQHAGVHYEVDPAVIPGGLGIEADPSNWQGWDINLNAHGNNLKGTFYLFGEGKDLRGVMDFMENRYVLKNPKMNGNILSFNHEAPFGELSHELKIDGDSLHGKASLPVASLECKGKRIGGSDTSDGKPLPEFKKIEPLTPEQTANILGGEACMWAEMVDGVTVESRIWPRTAAIAEKFWSPRERTINTEDMYRRLLPMDDRLENLGVKHRSNAKKIIKSMGAGNDIAAVETLIDVLEEDKFFNRMIIYKPELLTTTPLNRVVDAARPESYVAYRFNKNVRDWTKTNDVELKSKLINQLSSWSENHEKLIPHFDKEERLNEVKTHSENLSKLSKKALLCIEGKGNIPKIANELDSLLIQSKKGYGGTILAVHQGLQSILEGCLGEHTTRGKK